MRTRKTMWLPLLAASALVLAGCADEDDRDGDGASAEQPAEDGTGPGDEESADGEDNDAEAETPDTAAFEERAAEIIKAWPDEPAPPAENGTGLQPVEDIEDSAAEDTALTALVGHGDCDLEWGAWAEETDELVIVGGWSVEDPNTEVCNEMLVIDPVEVELEEPLGDREVIDATTGAEPAAAASDSEG